MFQNNIKNFYFSIDKNYAHDYHNHFIAAKSCIMKTLKIYFILLFATFYTSIFAQFGDCSGALLLEDKNDITFNFSTDENQLSDILSPLCEGAMEVFNEDGALLTHWFTWTIKESGTLYFTLSMQLEFYDLDFILYKSAENGNPCATKEAIRCMYSGSNINNGVPDNQCSMETGLSPSEDDLFENAGCINGNNSFLQQLETVADEQYILLVLDYNYNKGENTLLELCGTATLGVNDSPCFTLDTEEQVEENRLALFPNPSNDELFLSNNNVPTVINFPFTILDQVGRVVIRKEDNSSIESIETSSLHPGIYLLNFNDGQNNSVLKFIKQ